MCGIVNARIVGMECWTTDKVRTQGVGICLQCDQYIPGEFQLTSNVLKKFDKERHMSKTVQASKQTNR